MVVGRPWFWQSDGLKSSVRSEPAGGREFITVRFKRPREILRTDGLDAPFEPRSFHSGLILMEAISQAGWFREFGRLKSTRIVRTGQITKVDLRIFNPDDSNHPLLRVEHRIVLPW